MRNVLPPRAGQLTRLPLALALVLVSVGCGGPLAEPTTQPHNVLHPTVEVEVFFTNEGLGDPCTDVFPVVRTVDRDDPVVGALEALLAGPTAAEQAAGYDSWFTAATANTLLDAHRDDHGTVHVIFTDLRELLPDASSSCGSAGLLAQLDRTLTALDGITATRYALADQPAFYTWLQLADPDAPPPEQPDEPAPAPQPDAPVETDRPEPSPAVDLDAGWTTLPDFEWPVSIGCCDAPTTGPPSPDEPLPQVGWPADGHYAVEEVRPADDLDLLRLTIRRWLRLEELPDMWEGSTDVLEADRDEGIERQLPIADLAVILVPVHDGDGTGATTALYGEPGALARLLTQGIDPAFRQWVHEPLTAGVPGEALYLDLMERGADLTFPFGPAFPDHDYPLVYRGPLGSQLVVAASSYGMLTPPAWPPGYNGLYGWYGATLEIRDGEPLLYIEAGQYAG
jgi:hypothetical protein